MSLYRTQILNSIVAALKPLAPVETALDFGSGDGFFAARLGRCGHIGRITPIDVVERPESEVRPTLYRGDRLPFDDASFDLVYAVDVLHHCPNPLVALRDLARCSRRYILLKDHNHSGALGKAALAVLDEVGNRRFGIPSPYLYQRDWQWVNWLESAGFQRRTLLHPMLCHTGLLGRATNALQFMGLWSRDAA